MPPGAGCPDPATLDAFVKGRLPAEQRPAIEQHLDGCTACRRSAVRLISHPTQSVPENLSTSAGTLPIKGTPATGGELHRGEKVGRHIVIGRVGAGGMGTVYAAYDTTLERKIALKFLSKARAAEPDAARLMAEASAMARLSHPNVVTVHDVGIHEGQPYLAMEYVQGPDARPVAPRAAAFGARDPGRDGGGGPGAGCGPHRRPDSPGRQTPQRAGVRPARPGHRLRPLGAHRPRPDRLCRRHAGLHGARAVRGRPRHPGHRCVRLLGDAVRAAVRTAPLHRRRFQL